MTQSLSDTGYKYLCRVVLYRICSLIRVQPSYNLTIQLGHLTLMTALFVKYQTHRYSNYVQDLSIMNKSLDDVPVPILCLRKLSLSSLESSSQRVVVQFYEGK